MIEDAVKINQDLTLGNLGDIVHCLAGVVADAGILVREAGEHGRDDLGQEPREVLDRVSRTASRMREDE